MIIMSPKKDAVNLCPTYEFGMCVELNLHKEQKWKAKKRGGYWWLSRKGSALRLRLTEAALRRLFVEIKNDERDLKSGK